MFVFDQLIDRERERESGLFSHVHRQQVMNETVMFHSRV